MPKFDSKTFNAEAFASYSETVPKKRLNQLIKANIFKSSEEIREALKTQTGSYYAVIPMYGRISGTPDNYDGNTSITDGSMGTYERGVVAFGRAKSFTERDFSYDITSGVDFMSQVAQQVSEYWDDVNEDTLISIIKGIFAMTSTGGLEFINKHTYDITEATDTKVAETTLNDALQQASGDKKSVYSFAIMNSKIATSLENKKLLKYLTYTTADGIEIPLNLAHWNGKLVLVDDSITTETSDNVTKYITYALGEGAFDYEKLDVKVPYEMDRDPRTNGGQDTLYTRERIVYAPKGISFTKSSVASFSPTNAELENGANWDLVKDSSNNEYYDHKEIPIAKIVSLG